jgi:hypothetical protein
MLNKLRLFVSRWQYETLGTRYGGGRGNGLVWSRALKQRENVHGNGGRVGIIQQKVIFSGVGVLVTSPNSAFDSVFKQIDALNNRVRMCQ